jgi:hypothetical protein
VLPPKDFLRRLIATIPPKGMNVVRFHGVFAPRATARPALQALLPKQPPHKPDDRITGGPSTSQPSTLGKNGPLVLLKSGPPLKVRTI